MKNNYGKIILLAIIGSLFAYILYNSYYYDNLFEMIFYLILGTIGIILLFKIIRNDNQDYKKSRRISNYLTSIIGILIFSINIGIYTYYEIKINSPSLIKARIFAGYADFKKNGEYVIISGPWASRTHFYGNYVIKDSIITVDRKEFDDVLTTNRFVIRNSDSIIQENYKNKEIMIDKYLIQIDENGKEIKRKYNQRNFRLRIVIDNIK